MTAEITALTGGVTGAGSVAPETPVRPGRRGASAWRFAVLIVLGLYFLIPIAAAVLVTVRDRGRGGVTLEHYTEIPGTEGFAEAFSRSLALGGLTVVIALLLMVPTVVLVELRLRRLRTTVELLTLMPLVLPPIALVVGVRSVLSSAFTAPRIAVVIAATSSPRVTITSDRPVHVQATSGICIRGR